MISKTTKKAVSAATVLMVAVAASFCSPAESKDKIDWDKRLAKGYKSLEIGDYDKAMQFFQTEIDHHPESGAARTGMGMAFKRKGKTGEAVAAIRRATEVEPDYADAYYELGSLLESNKDFGEAEKCFEKYLQLAPLTNKKSTVEDRIRNCKENM